MTDSDQVPTPDGDTLPHTPAPREASDGSDEAVDDQQTSHGRPSTVSGKAPGETPPPTIEGYEILGELGRGGMGVVYEARDLKLDRTVALKVIIGGRFASETDIQRFRLEAESAARLDHEAIVPIYEIGETGGNHFFAMKFIEGGSLSHDGERLRDDPRAAAELLIKVAGAVQHAHERGVLHRDLKPANVLLDDDGSPYVTDLGLAKRIDSESELTQTGQAMGTPGFMAPEQAQGRRDITTAADIFSLGAILFWLQTGEPPFKGDTVVETLMSTINDEIPSLKKLRPNADADLDLICQKAMHRDPQKRYRSAAAFANDLQAWLNGELLTVRAPTAVNLASIWIRKNLRTVIGASATGLACGLFVGGICMLDPLRRAAQREFTLAQLGHSDPAWVAFFDATRRMGEGWQTIQLLIVPAITVCAVLNILLVRPQSREANIVSALTASLAAGAIALLVGLGWQPMNQASIKRGSQDIELLASAVWLESDQERELAQLALIQRYPGLADMEQTARQGLTLQKIEHDQDVGIVPGLWWGVGFAGLFVVLPMFSTCVLSGVAWLDGMRGWNWFGSTMERCVYCLIFFLIIGFQLTPVPPSIYLTLLCVSLLAFALYVAVSDAKWYWRLALAITPFYCTYVVQADAARMRGSPGAAGVAATVVELRDHAEQMDRLVSRTHDPFVHYKAAIAWLSLGEEERYQSHCRELLSRFDNAFRPEIAGRLAKVSLLRPDLQAPQDQPTFHILAELASNFESSPNRHWFYLTRAISEQRQGNAAIALRWNAKARETEWQSTYIVPCSYVVDALAYLDLNEEQLAGESLLLGRETLLHVRAASYGDGHDVGWVDWCVYQILEQQVLNRMERDEAITQSRRDPTRGHSG